MIFVNPIFIIQRTVQINRHLGLPQLKHKQYKQLNKPMYSKVKIINHNQQKIHKEKQEKKLENIKNTKKN